jgi:hypothetical protein
VSLLEAGIDSRPRTTSASYALRGAEVGSGFVITVAVVLSVSLVAGWLHLSPWATPWSAGATLAGAVAVSALLLRWARASASGGSSRGGALLALPVFSVLAVGIVGAVRPAGAGIEWFLGGDHPRHAVYVADTWWQGSLTYATEGYPRGWHSVLANLWEATWRAGLDGDGMLALLEVMALASLVLSAVLALATAHFAHALSVRSGVDPRLALVAGLVAGSMTLLNFSLANYQALGYENSLLTAVVLAVCGREVVTRAGSRASLVVCGAGTLVVANSWQLLLPAVAVPALWCAYRAVRSGGRRRATALLLVPVVIGLGAPGVVAVVTGVGLGHASEAGPDSPVPVPLLVAGVVAAAGAAWWRRKDPGVVVAATMTVIPTGIAVALAAGLGVELLHYYPSKLLWQTTVLGVAWVGAAAVVCAPRLISRMRGGAVVLQAALVLLLAYCHLMPWGSQLGIWSTTDGSRVVAAVTTDGADDATTVWLEDSRTTDAVARILLDVLRVDRTRERVPQAGLDLAQQCDLLRAAGRPVVLSTADPSAVSSRYACVEGVELLRVVVVP